MRVGECEISVIIQKPGEKTLLQCLAASKHLKFLPKRTRAGNVVVPAPDRQLLEEALTHYANLISVSKAWSFTISSTHPAVAFIAEDDEERRFLEESRGIQYPKGNRVFPQTRYMLSLSDPSVFEDRLDGVALLAQSVNSKQPSASFMTHARLFERAFGRSFARLKEALGEFLAGAGLGYSPAEIETWISRRHGVSHADVSSKPIMLDVDVSWVTGRTEQAAYDVLANKLNWSSVDSDRRSVWKPICGTTDSEAGLLATRGHAFEATMTLFDEFRRFPLNLEGMLTALPDGWWAGSRSSS